MQSPRLSPDGKQVIYTRRWIDKLNDRRASSIYIMNADGSGLRQITTGDYDDIEPTYLPNGDIVFVSTRCKRWVNCWLTQVAVRRRPRVAIASSGDELCDVGAVEEGKIVDTNSPVIAAAARQAAARPGAPAPENAKISELLTACVRSIWKPVLSSLRT